MALMLTALPTCDGCGHGILLKESITFLGLLSTGRLLKTASLLDKLLVYMLSEKRNIYYTVQVL